MSKLLNLLCFLLQAAREEQRLPKNLRADVLAEAPPLLIDSKAPQAPFERLRGGCELLEKPDTPIGDMVVSRSWLCPVASEMANITVSERQSHPALLREALAHHTP